MSSTKNASGERDPEMHQAKKGNQWHCIGSPTLGKLLGIPGLRTWRVAKFPPLWCYFEHGDHLDVVRLLGERQDIAAILGNEFASS
jgi:hypothetical protein